VKYIHSANVLHRDLKPSNILLNSDCSLRVADFGLARSIAALEKMEDEEQVLTEYVATRWYRAPEILLASTKYTKGVDMWSVGCILGELLGGKPIFPGNSTMNQLDKIIELTGRPTSNDIKAIQSTFAVTILESLPITLPKSMKSKYPHAVEEALDLLARLVIFNPEKRITADESLKHPYLGMFYTGDEPSCGKIIKLSIDDNHKRSIDEYRISLYKDIKSMRKQRSKNNNNHNNNSSAVNGSAEKVTAADGEGGKEAGKAGEEKTEAGNSIEDDGKEEKKERKKKEKLKVGKKKKRNRSRREEKKKNNLTNSEDGKKKKNRSSKGFDKNKREKQED